MTAQDLGPTLAGTVRAVATRAATAVTTAVELVTGIPAERTATHFGVPLRCCWLAANRAIGEASRRQKPMPNVHDRSLGVKELAHHGHWMIYRQIRQVSSTLTITMSLRPVLAPATLPLEMNKRPARW